MNFRGIGNWSANFFIVVLLTTSVVVPQKTENVCQTYEPKGAMFSLCIPSNPLSSQWHVFDSSVDKSVYRLIESGKFYKSFNFEIEKDGKRSFAVSILQIQTKKIPVGKFITDLQAKTIGVLIGDGLVHSKIENLTANDSRISRWTYKRKGGLRDDDKDDGTVYIKRSGANMVIVAVKYDYAEPGDPAIEAMLDSLTLTKK